MDQNGNVYFSGYLRASGYVGGVSVNGPALFLAKFNKTGQTVWVKSGTTAEAYPNCAVALAGASIVMNGTFYGGSLNWGGKSLTGGYYGGFVASFDLQGTLLWMKKYSQDRSNIDNAPPVPAPNGDFYALASCRSVSIDSTNVSSFGNSDVFLMKFSSAGTLKWVCRGGGTEVDYATCLAADVIGNVYAGGFSAGTLNFSGISADTSAGGAGFVAKYSNSGQVIWVRRMGGMFNDAVKTVCADNDGGVLVAGIFQGIANFGPDMLSQTFGSATYLAKLDAAGNFLWATKVAASLAPASLVTDGAGGCYLAGSFTGLTSLGYFNVTSLGVTDIVIAKFSGQGDFVWVKQAGFLDVDSPVQLALSPQGDIYCAGNFQNSSWFDQIYVEGYGGESDAFLAKITSEGTAYPAIITPPRAQVAYLGGTVTFSVAASSGFPMSYQWYFDGEPLTGETNAALTIPNVMKDSAGYYCVEISNAAGTVRSVSVSLAVPGLPPVWVTTVAGNGTEGYQDAMLGSNARFRQPNGIAVQSDGVMLVSDGHNHLIRVVEPNGTVGTYAGLNQPGFLDGPGSFARFNFPLGLTQTAARDVYIADTGNNVIRKISPFGARSATTIAGTGVAGYREGAATNAQFNYPTDLVADDAGNILVTEFNNHVVRKITPQGQVSTLAGGGVAGWRDGAGTNALFKQPAGIARDAQGNFYITEWLNHRIRKISPQGNVTTLAGTGKAGFADGPAGSARLNNPDGITVDSTGNIYFTDFGNHAVRRLSPDGLVVTIAGTGAPGYVDGDQNQALFRSPGGITACPDGSLLVADTQNHAIRKIEFITTNAPPVPFAWIDLHPGITIYGQTGKVYRIEASENLANASDWTVVGTLLLTAPVQTWYDSQPATRHNRYYRVKQVGY